MKILFRLIFCALLIASVATFGSAQEPTAVVLSQGKPQSFESMLDNLSKANVVFVGENHDHKRGHALELVILKGLAARNKTQAFALEMFERDVQQVLDEYLAGYITEASFLQASRPWPNYKTDYAPLIGFCKEQKLPVVASNAPRRYVNIVSRKGQTALLELPKASKAYLPALPYTMEIPAEYDRQLTDIFTGGHDSKDAPQPSAPMPGMPTPENLKQAQGLWDSTMADSIAKYVRKSGRKVMHINGSMHTDSGFGIVDRLRHTNPHLKIMLVTIRPSAHYPDPPAELPVSAADYIIVTPADDTDGKP